MRLDSDSLSVGMIRILRIADLASLLGVAPIGGFLSLSRHDLSGGSRDGPDEPSDTGEEEDDEDVWGVGVWLEQGEPESYYQSKNEQGHAEDTCDQCHGRTPERGQSAGIGQITLRYKVNSLAAALPSVKRRSSPHSIPG